MAKVPKENGHFPTPTLQVNHLSLRRGGKWLFRDLSLTVNQGSFIAVVGPSGAGKTSFLNCLAGVIRPTEGEFHYEFGKDDRRSPDEFRRHLGFIFQNLNLSENSTVLNNVLCGRLSHYSTFRTLFGFPRECREEAYSILFNLGISEYVHRWVAEISGGEKQRVCTARAILQDPCIYFADEPVSQLDAYLTGRVLGLLKAETVEKAKTVFCVIHDASLIQRFADRVLSFNREHPDQWHLRDAHHS